MKDKSERAYSWLSEETIVRTRNTSDFVNIGHLFKACRSEVLEKVKVTWYQESMPHLYEGTTGIRTLPRLFYSLFKGYWYPGTGYV